MREKTGIGVNIAEARREAGLTQEQLADALDIWQSQLARYEAEKQVPGADMLGKMATRLGVSVDRLIFGSGRSAA